MCGVRGVCNNDSGVHQNECEDWQKRRRSVRRGTHHTRSHHAHTRRHTHHNHTHAHTHAHTHTLTDPHTHTLTDPHTQRTHTVAHTPTHPHTHTVTVSLSHTHRLRVWASSITNIVQLHNQTHTVVVGVSFNSTHNNNTIHNTTTQLCYLCIIRNMCVCVCATVG